jgi:RHS repeat-associated protein
MQGNRICLKTDTVTFDMDSVDYQYDLRDRLIQVTKGSTTNEFKYRPDGLRHEKSTPTKTVRYLYDDAGRVIAESDSDGNIVSYYIWGPDRVLVKKEVSTGNQYFYLYNGHGDVVQITDQNGNIVNNYAYDEWGNIIDQVETIDNPFRYAGEIHDPETGLYYLKARYYDPSIGRFISEDSFEGAVTNPLTLNVYTYGYNNPLLYIDPSGNIGIGQIDALLGGVYSSVADEIKSFFNRQTYIAMYELVRAIANKQVNLRDLATSIGASAIEPFVYLEQHSKNVWLGKPSDSEVREYGKQLGNVVQMVVGAVTGGVGAKVISQQLGKVLPKFSAWVEKVGSAYKGAGQLEDLIRLKSLGRGSTGRTLAKTLNEQLAMKEILSNPLKGAEYLRSINMNDSRWLAKDGWQKMQRVIKTSDGKKIIIHFHYNKHTSAFDDFKFIN